MGKKWKQCQIFIFLASKITTYGDCRHEIKRRLLLERKAMTNLNSVLKSRDITLPTKVRIVKAVVFPVVMYGCESWTIKKAKHQKTDAFELWCWRTLLKVPWAAMRSNQSILKEISPEYSLEGLISFRIDWFDFTVQGTLKSLLQHHGSKASVLQRSALFMVQLSHPYMTTGKTIVLTRCTFFGKVMSLLFNMLSRLVIIFLPRSKPFLISWLQSPSAVILEPLKIKSVIVFTVSPSICHDGTRCHDLSFLNVEF